MDTLSKLSTQLVNYNKNILELYSKLDEITTSGSNTVSVTFQNELGVNTVYSIPSFGYMINELNRLNENIKSLYGLDTNTVIDFGDGNYKKIVSVDLNKEPTPIKNVDVYKTFFSSKNNFYDNLLNPYLYISVNLDNKINDNIRKIVSRKYMIDFEKDTSGNLTTNGQSAYSSFLSNFNGKNNVNINDFLKWGKTTVGVVNGSDMNYDEEIIDVEPNELLYDGTFTVIKVEEDLAVNKIWYYIDTLNYFNIKTGESREMVIGDELIINGSESYTRYRITDISKVTTLPRIAVNVIEGYQPIPVITNALKIYKTDKTSKSIKVGIGYNEKSVLFVKPLDTSNNIVSKEWSLGTGFNTSEFKYVSNDSNNGKTMQDFYTNNVYDIGLVIKDLSSRTPLNKGVVPDAPILVASNFKVVEVNTHLTKSSDVSTINKKIATQKELKSEITQLDEAIKNKTKESRLATNISKSESDRLNKELQKLIDMKSSKSSALQSVISDVVSLSNSPAVRNASPKYRVRGFWDFPTPKSVYGTLPQEVIQFKIEYRYLTKGSDTTDVKSYEFIKNDGTKLNAAYSNWMPIKTDVRKRVYDSATDTFTWAIEDVSNSDTPNINQLDIPITFGESVQIRIKSVSEAGYPDSPLESDWSDILTVQFPDEIVDTTPSNSSIINDITKDELVIKIKNELSNVEEHLSNTIVVSNKTYYHDAKDIYYDANESLADIIKSMQAEIVSLREQLNRTKGKLVVSVFRGTTAYSVKNETELSFNIECEDYLDRYVADGISGRVYNNNIYAIKEFYIKIENAASDSPLGLISSKTYESGVFYNKTAPQTFWVNDRDELLYSNTTGVSKTQLNNQFVWLYNYNDGNETTVNKISENISNNFTNVGNNSISNVLSLAEYNVGYSENELLTFVEDNKSLMDVNKWVDTVQTVQSNEKLLSTVHPVVQSLDYLTDRNSSNIRNIDAQGSIIIPISVYFKMNAIDPNDGNGLNYDYIDLNKSKSTVRHTKVLKLYLENENENKPFVFKIKFNLNRNKIGISNFPSTFNVTSGDRF